MGITFFSTMPAAGETVITVSPAQAVHLFKEARLISCELTGELELAAWTFAGGVVLILDHTAEPPCFRLGLDTPDG